MRNGLLRLCVAVAIPWTAWFGYAAYDSDQSIHWYDREGKKLNDRLPAGYTVGDAFPDWYIFESIPLEVSITKEFERYDFAKHALMALPLGLPILYLVAGWIVAGFHGRSNAMWRD
jgi:hypothetical protein